MNRGSQWRKWDLHVHTPASIVHEYPGEGDEVWDRFIADLESLPAEFSVIGVNDYLFVDGYERLLIEKEKGRLQNIDLLLPVIELRLDKFAGTDTHLSRANIHVIFDALSPDLIRVQFLSSLSRHLHIAPPYKGLRQEWEAVPTRESLMELGNLIIESVPEAEKKKFSSPLREGFNNLNIPIESVRDALKAHYFRGKHVIAVGKTEWTSIKWNDHSIADKKDLINGCDCVFVASTSPEAYATARSKLIEQKVNDKLLDCSDAHHPSTSSDKDRVGNCYTWVKADPTFRGLKLALLEFEKRVFVGDVPEKLKHVRQHPTRYIKQIAIGPQSAEAKRLGWFDFELELNQGLVAVIGNKGSGKSALLDTIGLLGNSTNEKYFSFLNKEKFRHPRKNLADHFVGTMVWESGEEVSKGLSNSVQAGAPDRVRYLPQHYIEILCNEIKGVGAGDFNAELGNIVFGHVDEADRLGFESIEELINYRTEQSQRELNRLRSELASMNDKIVELERTLSEDEQERLRNEELRLSAELAAVEAQKPEPQPEPTEDDPASKRLSQELDAILGDLNGISEEREQLESERSELTKQSVVTNRILGKLTSLEESVRRALEEIASELNELGWKVNVEDLVRFEVDHSSVTDGRKKITRRLDEIETAISGQGPSSLSVRQKDLSDKATKLKEQLSEPQRRFVAYQQSLRDWENRCNQIKGAADIPKTLAWVTARRELLRRLPQELEGLRGERRAKSEEIHSNISRTADVYRELYRPIEVFLADFNAEAQTLPVSFTVDIVESAFAEGLWQRINRQTRGTFSGIKESEERLRDLTRAYDFNVSADAVAFAEEIQDSLHHDKREGAIRSAVRPENQLRQGTELQDLYDFIFGFVYLKPEYSLRFGQKGLEQLSPGERGLLLLIFYLLVDSSDLPLIVDQPEENLDNQTIYETLVRALARAVKRRQVIVATHSANVAVVCDSEQVIHASRNPATDEVTYSTGSLENPPINAAVIDVLEGTRPALDNRYEKYVS
jgi:ABC-type lipoprotein export system ATPase subunit